MKRIIAVIMALMMIMSLAACGAGNTEETTAPAETTAAAADTVGTKLLADFKSNPQGTAQEIADRMLQSEVIEFMGATMPVEPGPLAGFGETEIKDFKEGVMFSPMIGTIPFVGYIFTLDEGADVEAFKTTLKDNADLRWNICTEAEELVVDSEGSTVFFLMCPKSFEEAQGGDAAVGGMEVAPEGQIPAEDGITLE